ncbi:hypothetical protein BDV09DRAFT_197046 [Aspergillus tetrazonus]
MFEVSLFSGRSFVPPMYNTHRPSFTRWGTLKQKTNIHQRRAADRYRLRMHRARTVALTNDEIVEVRAAQRTFEGAYIRTALSQFSFALVVLKIFTNEFYSTGALFAVYGTGVLIIGLFRRQQGNRQFFSEVGDDGVHRHKFRTSGNAVVILTALSIAAYATLIALTLRLDK